MNPQEPVDIDRVVSALHSITRAEALIIEARDILASAMANTTGDLKEQISRRYMALWADDVVYKGGNGQFWKITGNAIGVLIGCNSKPRARRTHYTAVKAVEKANK